MVLSIVNLFTGSGLYPINKYLIKWGTLDLFNGFSGQRSQCSIDNGVSIECCIDSSYSLTKIYDVVNDSLCFCCSAGSTRDHHKTGWRQLATSNLPVASETYKVGRLLEHFQYLWKLSRFYSDCRLTQNVRFHLLSPHLLQIARNFAVDILHCREEHIVTLLRRRDNAHEHFVLFSEWLHVAVDFGLN